MRDKELKTQPSTFNVHSDMGGKPFRLAWTARLTSAVPGMLVGLMGPMLMMVLNATMFGVALPELRDGFNIPADLTAWLVTAYVMPFVIFMPLYGRLGDGLGKRRLFIIGVSVFLTGTVICWLSTGLPLLILGRIVQGIGAAGINPLSIALISDRFPPAERGKALGTWNSLGPIATMIGPTLGGFLVDTLTWRTIFIPVLLVGLAAVWGLSRLVPAGQQQFARPGFLRTFDWTGVAFLAVTTVGFFSFTSSRPITGVAPLRDWRLLAMGLAGLTLFLVWERFRTEPFIRLALFRRSTFSRASLTSASRMFLMSAVFFLTPLYLTDIHQVSASGIGVQLMIHGIGLLATMRLGGQLADRWGSRVPVMLGAGGQMGAIVYLAFLPADTALMWVTAGLVAHGLGAGLYLAPLHRAAMSCIPADQTGMAAGLYSMVRFAGSAMGSALAGVLLQAGLDSGVPPIQAYQTVLWALAGIALLGVVIGGSLREQAPA